MVALRMSLRDKDTMSWKDWTTQIRRRLAAVQMWSVDETRPTFKSVLELAADATTLLALVDLAEQADHASSDGVEDAA